ncbi:hypothetical protein [Paracraurococcus lichenis]|uniref:Uncharacterized protein n=1 Tax=Paracraurococcus lichenis TaxID=3064888 RepID=A0ABT9E969_9PROT|nr:hypothetical protein [Paracraurococcus sp. LOR1-02]MDO9712746.1 hypothetical protein [Paracraurococcus sp. LOR1-02]
MRFIIGLLIAVSFVSALPAWAQAQTGSVSLLVLSCERGNMSACNAVLPLIGNACQRGQQQACSLHKAIRVRRQSGHAAEAVSDRTLHQRCFSGDAAACKRLQDGPQRDGKAEQLLDIPGLGH